MYSWSSCSHTVTNVKVSDTKESYLHPDIREQGINIVIDLRGCRKYTQGMSLCITVIQGKHFKGRLPKFMGTKRFFYIWQNERAPSHQNRAFFLFSNSIFCIKYQLKLSEKRKSFSESFSWLLIQKIDFENWKIALFWWRVALSFCQI